MEERWKDIQGFEGRYQVSDKGRVKSLERVTQLNGRVRTEPEKIMAYTLRSGYPTLILRKDGKRYSRQIHRLVAEAFLPNPYNLPIVNHKDFTRDNNDVTNLEWCTQKHNVLWSSQRMRHPKSAYRKSNTGEKYICKTRKGAYRLTVNGYYKSYKTLEEAIIARSEIEYVKKQLRR